MTGAPETIEIIARLAAEMNGEPATPSTTAPQHFLARILYEDTHVLVADKPAGVVTHPAYKHPDGTLCDAIFARQAARGETRPWLLHRLDRETSGVIVFAKTEAARRALVRQFEKHIIHKQYLALAEGALPATTGEITAPLRRDPLDRRRVIVDAGGQAAYTRYHVIGYTDAPAPTRIAADAGEMMKPEARGYTLALVEPLTGRTHQIRAHFAAVGTPLAGDTRYGSVTPALLARRAMLHAWRIGFRYPTTGTPFTVTAPPPLDLLTLLQQIGLADCLNTITTLFREEHPCD
ncbi:MAG TPA: RluA family pseudouridine synthase [Ktedonobacterales bacterium]|nr:RluA family pseudouridine synthase [Ktedonobacterales bacterium]